MCHLMLSRGNLLHHEQCESDKAETISEIFQHYAAAYKQGRRRLRPGEPCIDQERKVEDAYQREECLPEAEMRDVISGKERTEHEGSGSECSVVETDLLFAQSETACGDISLEEKRNYLHYESFSESVKYDECYIKPDVLFCKEVAYDGLQLFSGGLSLGVFHLQACRQAESVIDAQQDEKACRCRHYDSPCMERSFSGSGSGSFFCVDEYTGKVNEKTCGDKLCYIIECSLPADIFGLVLLGKFRHVKSVKRYVVGCSAECHNRQQSYAYGKEAWQVQGKSYAGEAGAADDLCRNDDQAFAGYEFQERAP